MRVIRYDTSMKSRWDVFVRSSRNGTFLFERDFMDYHRDRFEDCSLMLEDKGRLCAVLPACWNESVRTVSSHNGLTYGGLVMSKKTTGVQVLDAFNEFLSYYRNEYKAYKLIYKPVPHIYHYYPSEEDLYALFRYGATLTARAISSTVAYPDVLPLRPGRMAGKKKSIKSGYRISCLQVGEYATRLRDFWAVLTCNLAQRHHARPVHTYEEMRLLAERFPEHIYIYVVLSGKDVIVGGCVLFLMKNVVHVQYITSTEEGRHNGAVDFLFASLIPEYAAANRYFDFGVSTEDGGRFLNEGLLSQKEGFGARCVCYDTYEITLNAGI